MTQAGEARERRLPENFQFPRRLAVKRAISMIASPPSLARGDVSDAGETIIPSDPKTANGSPRLRRRPGRASTASAEIYSGP
jgi:hypothetical protein